MMNQRSHIKGDVVGKGWKSRLAALPLPVIHLRIRGHVFTIHSVPEFVA